MCCLTQDPANPYTVAIIDCCTLKIQNADGTLIDTFNLLDLDYQVANGILYLKDGVNTRTINVTDAPTIFGVADMAAVLAWLDASVTSCKCGNTPSTVTLDVLNCDGTTTPTNFASEPAKVELVQTKPIIICKSSVDFEIGCSSVDGRILVRTYIQDENGVITSQIFEQDGITAVGDGSILVRCNMDIEDVEFCFQDITDKSIRYRQVIFVNTATNAVVSTVWIDATGTAIAAPTNIEPCGEVTAVPHVSGCIKRSLGQLACVENVQTFFIPTSGWGTITIDANDGNGNYIITQTLTTPADAAVYAAMIAASGTPNTRISEDINGGFIINFWNGNIGNVTQVSPTSFQYEYFIEPGVTDTPSALPSPCVDPVGNQAYIDTATLLRGAFDSYGIGNPSPNGRDITFVITTYGTNTVPGGGIEVIHAKQIVTRNTDGSYEERYYSTGDINTEIIFNPATDTFSTNCDCKKEIFATHIKYHYIAGDPNVIPPSCTPIQQVKEKDSCTGLETYRYIIEDGAGNLVDAASVITGFDEANVVISCPQPVVEEFDIKEREVCVTIDGSAQSYEAIKVYKRSRTSGLATLIHYETKGGDVINGTIAEVCCTCETLCDVPTSASNKVAFGYATLFNGSWVAGDRITGGEELYLDYLEVDGNILVNSPRTLGSTTGGFTATDMGYGIGYNKIVDLLNTVPEFAANGVRFVTAAAPFAPNGTSYDPMMWGVEYDDTKDVRIVLRDKLLISGSSHSYSIRLNPDPAQTYDALINVVTGAVNDWDINNVSNYTPPMLLQNITAI